MPFLRRAGQGLGVLTMTAIQAATALVFRPLRFGDSEQIEAARLLGALDALVAAFRADCARLCPECKGKTYIPECDCGENGCERCSGGWLIACVACQETGLVDVDGEPWPPAFSAYEVCPDALEALRARVIFDRSARVGKELP